MSGPSPLAPLPWKQTLWLLGTLALLLLTGFLAEEVLDRERLNLEAPLMLWVHAHSGPGLESLSVWLDSFAGAPVMALALPVALLVLYRFWPALALRALLGLGGSLLLMTALKFVFDRPRPELWPRLVTEHGASFPSGHSTLAAALATFCVLALWQTRWRLPVTVLAAAYALLVGYSRVVLGVHYPTDVLAGWLTGLSVTWWAYQGRPARQPESLETAEPPAQPLPAVQPEKVPQVR
ncbi:phosphatase PAP2 family protein [Deinococcus lacus]|uniref:Phosphatase PAP2 family protein n=1 Tax=Deinococcus lacus TaxID=392561 RepID=A0ABW1YII5_9DEIO